MQQIESGHAAYYIVYHRKSAGLKWEIWPEMGRQNFLSTTVTQRGPRFSEMYQKSCDVTQLIRPYYKDAVKLLECFDIKSTGFDWIISRPVYGLR
jgi:hypothetical protein